jgi:hypothetical protein
MKTRGFKKLENNDVISARVSDHHPMINDGTLFWNVMMQGKMHESKGSIRYNNGFGIVENDKQYTARLTKVGDIIAEIISDNKEIEVITLCEGPIQPSHVNVLMRSLQKYECMNRFICMVSEDFHKPDINKYPNWGLLMLADIKYRVRKLPMNFIIPKVLYSKLANRFQLWQLTHQNEEKTIGLGHFPFSGDESIVDKTKFSDFGRRYCHLVNHLLDQYSSKNFIFCADFNLNPYLIGQWKDRVVDEVAHHNSILFTQKEVQTVTVDGVLLSTQEKQKYSHFKKGINMFGVFKREEGLVRDYETSALTNNSYLP